MNAGATTLAFDNPGTGESPVALDENADEVIRGIASYARSIGDGRVAHFGMSFGGNFWRCRASPESPTAPSTSVAL